MDSSPVVGTLMPGGSPEVIFGGGDYWRRATGKPTATSMDLTELTLSGSQVARIAVGGITLDTPALADLRGNGELDVLEGTAKGSDDQPGGPGSGQMYAIGPDGKNLPGWPVSPVPGASITGQAVTADLYDNGGQDVLVPTPQGLYAYSPSGHLLWGVATGLDDSVGTVDGKQVVFGNAPLVSMDPNGGLGITVAGTVIGTDEGVIQHYAIPGGTIGPGAWPMWRHDPALSGNITG